MAILQVVEQLKDRDAEYTQTGRSYTRNFFVLVGSASSDYPANVFAAEDPSTHITIPQIGDEHPSDSRAVVRRITPKQLSDKGDAYQVSVYYDTKSDYAGISGDGDVTFVENPISRSPEVSWTFERTPEVIETALGSMSGYADDDWSAKTWTEPEWVNQYDPDNPSVITGQVFKDVPIVNTAGQSFDPPIMKDVVTVVGVLTRNELNWDGLQAIAYQDAVNSDSWAGFSPGMVRMHSISAQRIFEAGIWYWRVRYEVHARNHWLKVLKNEGLGYIKENGDLVVASDPDGTPYTQPVRLDDAGAIIDDPDDPSYYLMFKIYNELPFGPLNLE